MDKRIVLFRGKRVDNNDWCEGDLYQEKFPYKEGIKETMIVEFRPDLRLVSGAPDNNYWWREVYPESVGQFSGLTHESRNYFHGDVFSVILSDGKKLFKVIKYIPEKFGFCVANINDLKHPIIYPWNNIDQKWIDLIKTIGLEYEGNETDNPELLK